MVFLYRDGELVKMSKRTGETITLDELIEDVGWMQQDISS